MCSRDATTLLSSTSNDRQRKTADCIANPDSFGYAADSNLFLSLVLRACGGEQGDEAIEQSKWRAWSSFLLSLRRLLCRFVAHAAQHSRKAILEFRYGQNFRPSVSLRGLRFSIGTSGQPASGPASAVLMAMYRGEQMKSKPSGKETWERIAAQIREHGLPKRGAPKKGSVDTGIGRLADALLIRAERTIAELKLNDQQRSYLIRVLRSRLRSMVTLADRRSSPRNT